MSATEFYRCPDPRAQRDEFGRTPCNPLWGNAQRWRSDIDAWVHWLPDNYSVFPISSTITELYRRPDIRASVPELSERSAMELNRRLLALDPRDEFGRTPCNPLWGDAQSWRADIRAWVWRPERRLFEKRRYRSTATSEYTAT